MTCRYHCDDGLIFETMNGYPQTFRCPCPLGEKHSGPKFFPSDKKHERPVQIAVWRGKPRQRPSPQERAAGEDGFPD